MSNIKVELFRDNYQNFKSYNIPAQMVIEYGKKYGFAKSYPIFFIKNYSAQVLKANMKIVGVTEHAIVLYRDKLPKFINNGKMVFDWFEWKRDSRKEYPKIHHTQKPIPVLKRLIEIFTEQGGRGNK